MATAQKTRSSSTNEADRQVRRPAQDLITYVKDYARQKPEVAALWCFGIGFVLGWKLKPW
ncbi:MAG TPA: hypothetical protein VML55_02685 [Planctomycetaceae bacterium]|nr:hypothetical protein [Planctomycetaceae bacterium]